MLLDALVPRQSASCIDCSTPPPPCQCSANEECVRINRDCFSCGLNSCVAKQDSQSGTKSSGGVSKGALAGGIIGALLLLAVAIVLFFWYRKRSRSAPTEEAKIDVPASAETVLNRPDPTEKHLSIPTELNTVRVYNSVNDSSPNQTAARAGNYKSLHGSNPFEDNHSIQTTRTEGTNVIPIALVTPDTYHPLSPYSDSTSLPSSTSSLPQRPPRTPDLNLEHVNMSHDSLKPAAPYAGSTISGISTVSSRHSYMSGASDFLNEAPMIITPTKGSVPHVVGLVKAEFVNAPGSSPVNSSQTGLKPSLHARPSVRSPLASTSFGPSDVVREANEHFEMDNPFSDDNMSTRTTQGTTSRVTSGQPSTFTRHESTAPDMGDVTWPVPDNFSRPSSMYTQAGSVIDIGSATRVNVGLSGLSPPATADNVARSPFRTTMGRLVSPTAGTPGALQQQQQKALAHAHAQAQAKGLVAGKRISGSSITSGISARADSILESYPFVTPISDRPVRSTDARPTNNTPPQSPVGHHTITVAPPSPLTQQVFTPSASEGDKLLAQTNDPHSSLPAPPNRRTLGLSNGSQFSTASSGLGSFPFQIVNGTGSEVNNNSTPSFYGRQRASLDTLALTADLSSYPLGFDRDNLPSLKQG